MANKLALERLNKRLKFDVKSDLTLFVLQTDEKSFQEIQQENYNKQDLELLSDTAEKIELLLVSLLKQLKFSKNDISSENLAVEIDALRKRSDVNKVDERVKKIFELKLFLDDQVNNIKNESLRSSQQKDEENNKENEERPEVIIDNTFLEVAKDKVIEVEAATNQNYPEVDLEESNKKYPKEVEQNAKTLGYKAANLMFLEKRVIPNINEKLTELDLKNENGELIEAMVPELYALDSKVIEEYLDSHVDWRALWNDFRTTFLHQDEGKITEKSEAILEKLQSAIKESFLNLEKSERQLKLPELKGKLMVRSTGHEDSTTNANAGIHESLPSENDEASILRTIGEVVASYFSSSALKQRLALGDDITNPPMLSCLLQELIGEQETTQNTDPKESKNSPIPVSAVIFTHGDLGIDVYSTHGHGEGIVSGHGGFDHAFISAKTEFDGQNYGENIYQATSNKEYRLVPYIDKKTGKLKLREKVNNFEQKTQYSLPEGALRAATVIAGEIEKAYGGMNLDIECVYQNGRWYIVQARALTHEANKGKEPSSVNPELLLDNQRVKEVKGNLVTTSILTANIITDQNQIITCNTIIEAWNLYTNLKKDVQQNIKCVIVKEDVPAGDHVANNFAAPKIAIPVLTVKGDVGSLFTDLTKQNGKKLLIDPQFSRLIQIEIPAEFDEQDILKKGVFKSPLTTKVSAGKAQNIDFEKAKEKFQILKELLLEDRVLEAKNRFSEDRKDKNYLRNLLEKLSRPKIDDDQIIDFTELCLISFNLKKHIQNKGVDSQALSQTIIKTIAELYSIRKEIENSTNQNNDSTEIQSLLTIKYLNIYQKLNGLFLNQEKHADSAIAVLKNIKRYEDKRTQDTYNIPNTIQNPEQIEYYKELVTMEKFIVREDKKAIWIDFCKHVCSSDDRKKANLASIVADLIENNLHEFWINTWFLNKADECKESNSDRVDFVKLFLDIEKRALEEDIIARNLELNKAKSIIDKMEKMMGDFADPEKFTKSFEEYKQQIDELEAIFKSDDKDDLNLALKLDLMLKMGDVYDKSMKELQLSAQYEGGEGKKKQVDNFAIMVKKFSDIFKVRAKDYIEVLRSESTNMYDNLHNLAEQLENNSRFICSSMEKKSACADELMVTLYSQALSDIINNSDGEIVNALAYRTSFADFHSIFHQNYIKVIQGLYKKLDINSTKKNLPENVNALMNALEEGQTYDVKLDLEGSPQFKKPLIKFSYNLPLRSHSAKMNIEYDTEKETFVMNVDCVGTMVNGRWNNLTAYFLKSLSKQHDEIDVIDCHASFPSQKLKFSFKPEAIESVSQIVYSLLENTMIYTNDTFADKQIDFDLAQDTSEAFVLSISDNTNIHMTEKNSQFFLNQKNREDVAQKINEFGIENNKKDFLKENYNALALVHSGILTEEIINNFELEVLESICSDGIFYLITQGKLEQVTGVSFDQIGKDVDKDVKLKNYTSLLPLKILLAGKMTDEEISDAKLRKNKVIEYIKKNNSKYTDFLKDIALLGDEDEKKFLVLAENVKEVAMRLVNKKVSFNDLAKIEDIDRLKIIARNAVKVEHLLDSGVNFNDLMKIDDINKFRIIVANGHNISKLLKFAIFDELLKINDLEKLEIVVGNSKIPKLLEKSSFKFDELIALNANGLKHLKIEEYSGVTNLKDLLSVEKNKEQISRHDPKGKPSTEIKKADKKGFFRKLFTSKNQSKN